MQLARSSAKLISTKPWRHFKYLAALVEEKKKNRIWDREALKISANDVQGFPP